MSIPATNWPYLSAAVGIFFGRGILAGSAPESPGDPDSPDGRFKILNVPSRGRISVFERSSMRLVASTLSQADGTWVIKDLNPDLHYTVVGCDDRGQVNASIQDWVKCHVPEP